MNNIKVYTTSTCPWCVKAKNYLKSNGISFEEVNVGLDQDAAREMVQKSGQMGVPVLDINGNIVVGFDKKRIDGILGL
ncbi:glutaredoxin family protein [Clostridium isatidis]|uniref:NrdH-redoxin n=1 Tax=Clostridium isatidis TaxID=182773 RepID=A0A343JDB4_9CLOT|nr:glutaredoxin domain-containing protein [Clostridium isatidis]ASW43522.1 NrdH-redoxin [Clostridium isatidis]NLZ35501.1 NrdH-redoxin [Clostridiales bacterium]